VCDVNFGLNNARQLRVFKKRGLLARKLDLLEEKVFLMNRQRGVARCFHRQRLVVLDEEVRLLRATFKATCQEARNRKEVIAAKCAFVTFLDQEGKERCLEVFGPTDRHNFFRRLCGPRAPRFVPGARASPFSAAAVAETAAAAAAATENPATSTTGGAPARVRALLTPLTPSSAWGWPFSRGFLPRVFPAPEPEDIIWENLTTPGWLRFLKGAVSNLLICLLMIASFAFIFSLTSASRAAAAAGAGGSGRGGGRNGLGAPCGELRYLFNESGWPAELVGAGGRGAPVVTKEDVVADQHPTLYNLTDGRSGLLGCYCDAVKASASGWEGAAKRDSVTFADPRTGSLEAYDCASYHTAAAASSALSSLALVGASVVVTAVNLGLKYVYSSLIDFEGPASRTEKVLLLTRKLAFAMFVNTGCLTLVMNGNPSWFTGGASYAEASAFRRLQVFVGPEDDFGADWYLAVGSSLVLTMLVNTLAMNAAKYGEWAATALSRCLDAASCDPSACLLGGATGAAGADSGRSGSGLGSDTGTDAGGGGCGDGGGTRRRQRVRITSKTTQVQLEELHAGPPFVIYDRYASILNAFFVCIVYSAGMPLLLPVLGFTFALTYAVDKHTLLRVYRLPAALDQSLAVGTTRYLKYAVYLHVGLAAWMYSNPDIFEASGELAEGRGAPYFALVNATVAAASNTTAVSSPLGTNSSSAAALSAKQLMYPPDEASRNIGSLASSALVASGLLGLPAAARLYTHWANVAAYACLLTFVACGAVLGKVLPRLARWLPCAQVGLRALGYGGGGAGDGGQRRVAFDDPGTTAEAAATATAAAAIGSGDGDGTGQRMQPADLEAAAVMAAAVSAGSGRRSLAQRLVSWARGDPPEPPPNCVPWRDDVDEAQCPHSRLRHHPLYGHSGERAKATERGDGTLRRTARKTARDTPHPHHSSAEGSRIFIRFMLPHARVFSFLRVCGNACSLSFHRHVARNRRRERGRGQPGLFPRHPAGRARGAAGKPQPTGPHAAGLPGGAPLARPLQGPCPERPPDLRPELVRLPAQPRVSAPVSLIMKRKEMRECSFIFL